MGPWIFYNEPRQFGENSPNLRDWGANGIVMRDSSENLELLKLGIPTIISIRHKEYLEDHPNIVGDSKSMGKVKAEKILVEVSGVVTRQSTDILAIDDYEIAEAIRFIRKNRKKMIQVDEVADAVSVNRRKLERSFKKILGRSVHEEIKRCRIELISKFLVESDLPISRIATMMDFSVEHHISRYFQQETGMSPFEYRKKFSRLID